MSVWSLKWRPCRASFVAVARRWSVESSLRADSRSSKIAMSDHMDEKNLKKLHLSHRKRIAHCEVRRITEYSLFAI